MTKYKIREIEDIKKGEEVIGKKMVLKSDDQQNEEPRVTVWLDHPECADAKVGGYISGEMEKKDSGTPIPGRTGNYINRTLKAEGTVNVGDDGSMAELKRKVDILWGNKRSDQVPKVDGQGTAYPEREYPEGPAF